MVLRPASTPPIISPKPTHFQTRDQEPLSVLTMNPWKEKLGILKHFGPHQLLAPTQQPAKSHNKLPHTNIKNIYSNTQRLPKTETPSFAASNSRRRAPLIHPPPIHPLTFTQRKKHDHLPWFLIQMDLHSLDNKELVIKTKNPLDTMLSGIYWYQTMPDNNSCSCNYQIFQVSVTDSGTLKCSMNIEVKRLLDLCLLR